MVAILIIFALSGAVIAAGVVYAAINYVKCSRKLNKSQLNYTLKKEQTLIDISTTVKELKNADNETKKEILKELESLRGWIEKNY